MVSSVAVRKSQPVWYLVRLGSVLSYNTASFFVVCIPSCTNDMYFVFSRMSYDFERIKTFLLFLTITRVTVMPNIFSQNRYRYKTVHITAFLRMLYGTVVISQLNLC